jgi:hypothetical protein
MQHSYWNKTDIGAVILLNFLAAAIFAPVTITMVLAVGDISQHARWAAQMWESRLLLMPHFLYHLIVILIQPFVSFIIQTSVPSYANHSYELAGTVVVILSHILLASVLYIFLRSSLDQPGRASALCRVSLTLGLMLVWPITLFAIFDQHLYFGYIGVNTYHSPTQILLKPLALLLFLCVVSVFTSERNSKWSWSALALLASLVIVSTLAKPVYIICLLPGLGLYTLYAVFTKQTIRWHLLIGGIWIPGLVVLAWQYLFTYIFDPLTAGDSRIIFEPFAFYKIHNTTDFIIFKIALSILFPLSVVVFYFRQVLAHTALKLAWSVASIGIFYSYFLAEDGPRYASGNFLWSGQITVFILFVISLLFLIDQNREVFDRWLVQKQRPQWKGPLLICLLMFGLHVANGILWYGSQLLPFAQTNAW